MGVFGVTWKRLMLNMLRDRRSLAGWIISTVLLFPLLMFVFGLFMSNTLIDQEVTKVVTLQGAGNARSLENYLKDQGFTVRAVEDARRMVESGEVSYALIIPPDFETRINNTQPANIVIISDAGDSIESTEQQLLFRLLKNFNDLIVQERLAEKNLPPETVSPFQVEQEYVHNSAGGQAFGFLTIVPAYIFMSIITTGASFTVDAIAGEKQRQTVEPFVLTPASRTQFVLGNLAASLTYTLLSVFLNFVSLAAGMGLLLLQLSRSFETQSAILNTLPQETFINVVNGGFMPIITISVPVIAWIIITLLPIILLAGSVELILSIFARSEREAHTYLMPFYLLSIIPFLLLIALKDFVPSLWHFAIPIFGNILAMRELLAGTWTWPQMSTVTFVSYGCTVLAVWASVRLIHSEKFILRA